MAGVCWASPSNSIAYFLFVVFTVSFPLELLLSLHFQRWGNSRLWNWNDSIELCVCVCQHLDGINRLCGCILKKRKSQLNWHHQRVCACVKWRSSSVMHLIPPTTGESTCPIRQSISGDFLLVAAATSLCLAQVELPQQPLPRQQGVHCNDWIKTSIAHEPSLWPSLWQWQQPPTFSSTHSTAHRIVWSFFTFFPPIHSARLYNRIVVWLLHSVLCRRARAV